MSNKYDFGGSSDSSSNGSTNSNTGYAPTFKIAPFTKMRGVLSSMFVGNSDYGQSVAVTYEDAHIVDGILTKRTDKEQFKLFSWNDAPVIEDETLDCDDLPPVLTKSYAGDSYKYEILAARLEEDEEEGYGNDAMVSGQEYEGTEPIPTNLIMTDDDGQPEGRFTVYEQANDTGPSACAKGTATLLSSAGSNAVIDEDSKFDWITDNVELREELQGLEVVYAKVQRESNQSEHSFYFPVFVDVATGELILPSNENNTDSTPEPESEPMDDPDESPTDSTGPIDEFYETCDELEIDTEPAVIGLLDDMVADDDNELTEEMIDREEIVGDLVA